MLKIKKDVNLITRLKKIENELFLLKIEFSKKYKPAGQRNKKRSFFGSINSSEITAEQINSVIYKGMKDTGKTL